MRDDLGRLKYNVERQRDRNDFGDRQVSALRTKREEGSLKRLRLVVDSSEDYYRLNLILPQIDTFLYKLAIASSGEASPA